MKIYNPSGFSSKLTGSFSGSFVGDGSNITSISSDNIEFNFTALSSSAQIAEDISGSFTSLSSSIASDRLKNTTDTLTGDLTVTGTLTAQEFHTEFVSGSIIYESGSTQFGNSSDDTHVFRGQIFVSASDAEDIITSKNYSATGAPEQFQIKHIGGNDSVESLRGSLFLSSSNGFVVLQKDGGSVGIGTNNPGKELDVNGSIRLSTTGRIEGRAYPYTTYLGSTANATTTTLQAGGNVSMLLEGSDVNNQITLSAGGTARIFISGSGAVGIGNTNPSEDVASGGFTFINDASDDTFTQGPLLQFNGHNGTIRPAASTARIQIEGNAVHLNTNWANDVFLAAGGGCVGIGTDSAGSKLEIRDVQNAESLIKLFNNRQDSSNSPIFGIEASNASPVAKLSFYRGGESASGFMTFLTKASNAASLTEKMRITNTGLLQLASGGGGIRVLSDATSPSNLIEYYYSGTYHHGLEVEGDRGLRIYSSTGDSTAKINFYTEGSERMRIDSSGHLTLGRTSYDPRFYMTSTGGNGINERFYIDGFADGGGSGYGGGFRIYTRDTVNIFHERIRITSAGQIFFGVQGTSGSDITNGGFLYRNDSNKYLQFASGTHSNAPLIYFYRKDSGGTSVDTVGNISYSDTNLVINGAGQTGQLIAGANGYVGINTTPQYDLHVGGTTARLRVGPVYNDGDRDFVDLLADGQDSKIISNNERFHIENGSGDIIINPSSNVGIGVTNPYGKLHVQHTPSTTYNDTSFNSAPHITLIGNDGTNYYRGIRFSNNSGNREAFFGVVQTGDSSPFVFQVYGTTDGYKERLSIGGKNGYASMYARDYPQTSTSSATSIVDTGIIPEDGIYEIFIKGNANGGGSGLYKTVVHGYIYVAVDYTAPNVVTQIVYNQIGQEGGGSGNNTFTVEAKILYSGTEYSEVAVGNASSSQIRIKITGYNSSYVGQGQNVRILKRI